jgi:hypothetical protein
MVTGPDGIPVSGGRPICNKRTRWTLRRGVHNLCLNILGLETVVIKLKTKTCNRFIQTLACQKKKKTIYSKLSIYVQQIGSEVTCRPRPVSQKRRFDPRHHERSPRSSTCDKYCYSISLSVSHCKSPGCVDRQLWFQN